jgi:ribosomal protein L7/L12
MGSKEGEGQHKLLLQSVDPQNVSGVREVLQKLLGVGQSQANDIIDSVPIILLDEIADAQKAERIRDRFEEAVRLGAVIETSSETLEHTPRLRWPEEPEIARDGVETEGGAKEGEARNDEVLTLVKYNFVVDRRNVFRCPGCGKLFMIRELASEEAAEARAQAEIAERLEEEAAAPAQMPQAAPVAQAPRQVSGEQKIEEIEPIQERQKAEAAASPDVEIMDLATFEEGLSSIEYEGPEVPELALPPDVHAAPEPAKDFFRELESLPVEGGVPAAHEEEPASDEAVQKESELEELHPEEAMKFFEERRGKTGEEEPEESEEQEDGRKKIVAPRRGAGRRRMQRLRDKQDDRRKSSGRMKAVREEEPEEEEAPAEEVPHTEGFYGVVLSKIGSREKKQKAAKMIVELTGVHPEEARDMVEGMFVNVIRGISEEEANGISAKFKELGISSKVTLQKRKMRQSGRVRR